MQFRHLALVGAALGAMSACDAPKAAEPAAIAPVAVEPPPPKPFDAAEALSAVDQKVLCAMFARAVSDETVQVAPEDCAVTPTQTALSIATKDGANTLVVPLVEAGTVVQITSAMASPRAKLNEAHQTYSNAGIVFVGKAPASGLCMSVEYFAPDGGNNSMYVLVAGKPSDRFQVKDDAKSIVTAAYALPVVEANAIAPVALTRRETGMGIKSVAFRAC